MARVAKAGYIECPSATSELLTLATVGEYLLGRRNTVGSNHHRCLVQMDAILQEIVFRMKPYDLGRRRYSVPHTRLHTPDPQRLAVAMFWQGELKAREEVFGLYKWLETTATAARQTVRFDPLKIWAKLGRVLSKPVGTQRQEPPGSEPPSYPYQ